MIDRKKLEEEYIELITANLCDEYSGDTSDIQNRENRLEEIEEILGEDTSSLLDKILGTNKEMSKDLFDNVIDELCERRKEDDEN